MKQNLMQDKPLTKEEWYKLSPSERCRMFASELEGWSIATTNVLPNGREWDYRECHLCAIGYVTLTAPYATDGRPDSYNSYYIKEWLGIDAAAADFIFFNAEENPLIKGPLFFHEVQPQHVADALRYVADDLENREGKA